MLFLLYPAKKQSSNMIHNPLRTKLLHAARIDLALKLVWQATPVLTISAGIAIVISGILPLASAYIIKLIIDAVVDITPLCETSLDNPSFSKLLLYILGAAVLALFTTLVHNLTRYLQKAQTLDVIKYVHSVIHEQACEVDLDFYESAHHRNTLFRAQQEGPYRPTRIVNGLFTSGQNTVSFIGALSLLSVFSPILPLAIIVAGIPGIFLRLCHSDKIYAWQKETTEKERKADYFHWILTQGFHAQELRLFQLGRYFSRQFSIILKHLQDKKLTYEKQKITGDMIAQGWAVLCTFAALTYIAVSTTKGNVTIGDMVLYFQLLQKSTVFFRILVETLAHMYEDNLFLSHLYEFLSIKPQIITPDNPVPVPEKIQTGIVVENVSFFYNEGKKKKKILDNLCFSLKPGEIIALVGENGSGKSTIVKLLTRMYDPCKGTIYLDNTDIKQFDPDQYRKKISLVFQDHMRYYTSAKENIYIGDIEESRNFQKITAAAKDSLIHNKIKNLSKQYDTILGNWFADSQDLSKGQWQMLAIARSFFRNAEIVILDEPASSLDPIVQSQIFSSLRKLAKNRSVLIISHRYTHLKMADNILFLDNGRITEQGRHEHLMQLNKQYAKLYKLQVAEYT